LNGIAHFFLFKLKTSNNHSNVPRCQWRTQKISEGGQVS